MRPVLVGFYPSNLLFRLRRKRASGRSNFPKFCPAGRLSTFSLTTGLARKSITFFRQTAQTAVAILESSSSSRQPEAGGSLSQGSWDRSGQSRSARMPWGVEGGGSVE
ncbi:unnamed protein product [Protopolystoma xenopodis]|uniref:Uncharacterized protein n=1 Tax=Protopolystoma xenopodis TaxID=117903 RepID=A0A3S5CKM7_9PLAT|nr:unnamed protein product [Protopolystoma xenopodis]